MISNYRRIGDFIKQVKVKNTVDNLDLLLGIKIDKYFMPSVANIVGTDLSRYKVVKPGQFACNRMHVGRDYRIPIALSVKNEPFIVSPAYTVFEINNKSDLLPEYLMMWFSRKEFDRNAWFHTDADVRGGLPWELFCELELPVPTIQKQRETVKEYNTIVNRIKLNEQLNQKLEETAQAIYKHWFVDFEFPNENGKPYKSTGGIMVWNEELGKEIPVEWGFKPFTEVINLRGGGTPSTTNQTFWEGKIPFFTPKDISDSYYTIQSEKFLTEDGLKNCSSKKYSKNTVFVTARGTVGAVALAGVPMAMNQSCYAIIGDRKINQFFAHQLTLETIKTLKVEAIGAVFKALVTKDFDGQLVIVPSEGILKTFEFKVKCLYELLLTKSNQLKRLHSLKDLILSKMTKVENTVEFT